MENKHCFGILERVFPVSDRGIREIVSECFDCTERVSCLKKALSTKEGLALRSDILERAPVDGILGRIRRWSNKKELSHMAEKEKNKKV